MNGLLPDNSTGAKPAAAQWAELLRTLADPMRLRIIRLLEQAAQSGLRVGELAAALKSPQSTVSRHIKELADAGLTAAQREGTSSLYRLSDASARGSLKQLRALAGDYVKNDPQMQTDARRLARVLERRYDGPDGIFSQLAPDWDNIRRRWFGDTFQLEAMLAVLNPQWVIGDLGAGTGAMLPLLCPHVAKVIAIEPSAAMLKAARRRVADLKLENVELAQGSLEHLPIAGQTLDVALVLLVLHHVADLGVALAEMHRALKPGGLLLVVDLLPHKITMFREKMGHRRMGFDPAELMLQLAAGGFDGARWHTLPARASRSPEARVAVPDLFVLRAVRSPAVVSAPAAN